METKKNKKTKKADSSEKEPVEKEAPSQLDERRWSVVNFEACMASSLTYDEAVLEMAKHARKNVSGLCIVTDEAAARISKKH